MEVQKDDWGNGRCLHTWKYEVSSVCAQIAPRSSFSIQTLSNGKGEQKENGGWDKLPAAVVIRRLRAI